MKKALIFTNTLFQDHEVVYPYYRLLGEGFEVDIVADKRDSQGRVYGYFGLNMPCSILWSEFKEKVNIDDYNFLVIPGGVKSLEKLRQNNNPIEFIEKWNSQGKVSGYYNIKDDINNAGATFVDQPFVVDKNIISSPHYDHMGVWMEEAIKLYNKINGKSRKRNSN
jgi:protease I